MAALWALVRPHFFWIVLVSGGLFAFREWLAQHDANVRAEIQVRDLQTNIDSLKAQIAARQVDTQKQVQVIVKEVAAAKTPEQQIAEVNKLAANPIHAEPVLGDPSKVTVDLAPLLAEESECRQMAIKYGACQQDLQDRLAIEAEQAKQVDVLKKKPGFWRRLASDTKKIAIGIAFGAAGALIAKGI